MTGPRQDLICFPQGPSSTSMTLLWVGQIKTKWNFKSFLNLSNSLISCFGGHIPFLIKLHILHLCYKPKNDVRNKFSVLSRSRINEGQSKARLDIIRRDKNDKVQRLSPKDLINQCISRNSTCPWTCSFLRERTQFKLRTKGVRAERKVSLNSPVSMVSSSLECSCIRAQWQMHRSALLDWFF